MNQFSRQNSYAYLKNGLGTEEDMRNLAQLLKADGWAKLGLEAGVRRNIRSCMRRFEDIKYSFTVQDDAFRRLSAEIGSVESMLARVRGVQSPRLPACGGEVRILIIARELVSGGDVRLEQQDIVRALEDFLSMRALSIQEILFMPEALCIAVLEGVASCCCDAVRCADRRRTAGIWARCGGKGKLRGNEGAVFLEHAIKCTEAEENAALHRRIDAGIAKSGRRAEDIISEARKTTAQLLFRSENLLSAWHMLRRLDWQQCYEALSVIEVELKEDPSGVYPGMDDESKAEIRKLIGAAAMELGVEEYMIVNAALAEARASMKESGREDPRATVCYYLYDNEGRKLLSERLGARKRLSRIVPDPNGRVTAAAIIVLVVLAALLFAKISGSLLLAACMLPVAWVFVMQLIGKFYPFFIKPRRLLKMKVSKLSRDERVLVVIPALLSGEGRVQEILERMETAGCLEEDENIDFLLLGDFADGNAETETDDGGITAAVRRGIDRLNKNTGREKYYYLHRGRSFRAQDKKWMGENRKRGAVRALNVLLLGEKGAEAAFSAENSCTEQLANAGYRYVLTLDADTMFIPGSIQKLAGAMLHPLNRSCIINGRRRGYAVLQPAMRLAMHVRRNAYSEIMNPQDGTDSYPFTISDFYQDICASGNFSGKGIYDVRAFHEACEGKLIEEQTLSHDMVEGIFSGTGMAADIVFFENCPCSLSSELSRSHRWMRGDWQNAYLLFSKRKIRLIDRLRIAGNLLRSLYAPALLTLLVLSAWAGNTSGFALGIVVSFINALLNPFSKDKNWRRAVFKLAILPAEAKNALDAVLRTLWRTLVSGEKLMEWTAAADSANGEQTSLWGKTAAVLLLPGLLNPGWIIQTIALAALFLVGSGWAEDLRKAQRYEKAPITASQVSLLAETARRTWRFFEEFVPEDGNGLPPDNVQLDPPAGAAQRTSPTNIGLYLVSCIAAYELGFVRMDAVLKRVERCISTLEGLEKWHGQLYNWYDTQTLAPLRPRYVSSVDSGNLAAALMLVSNALKDVDADIAGRAVRIARQMDFKLLYDESVKLFRIGVDVESGIYSQAHYDLYASEARILSFTAMMLNQAPASHWQRLGRAAVDIGNKTALISWSGTMFEYLMPEIFMRSLADSLAGGCCGSVVLAQMEYGRRCARPWGVSESGYYAFDMHLNYQYRAFGLQAMALSANAAQDVVAPYASVLALCIRPDFAAENMRAMQEMGWMGEYGFYEAADYRNRDANGQPRIVKSHMAHHQGMILCAICNAMRDDAIAKCFMEIPQAQALKLLLEEKAASGAVRLIKRKMPRRDVRIREERTARGVRRDRYSADAHLLHGAGTTALLNDRGGAYIWHDGIQLNRFSGDLKNKSEGMYVHISSKDAGESLVMGDGGKIRFDAGSAELSERLCGVQADMKISVSPENGALFHVLTLKNTNDGEMDIQIAACFAVALAPEGDMRAHPAFQNLFIESRRIAHNALCFTRRPREKGKTYPKLIFAAFGEKLVSAECDMEKLVGRSGALGMAGGISECFEESSGNIINPCGALRMNVRLHGGEERCVHFALAAVKAGGEDRLLREVLRTDAPERSGQFACTIAKTNLHSAGISAGQHRILQRASALLFDAHLQPELNKDFNAYAPAPRELLWRAGISGDLPVICVDAANADALKTVRDIIRMHAFYRDMGVWTDLVLVNSHGNDYQQPLKNAFQDMIACSHLGGLMNQPGGVRIIDRQNADEAVLCAIERSAVLYFSGAQDAFIQLDRMLDVLNIQMGEKYRAVNPLPEPDEKLKFDNGYGGFKDGAYQIRLHGGMLPPAPWSNIIAEGESGAVVTERCGGFAWSGNSRAARLTAFTNDTLSEGWGWMFYYVDHDRKKWMRLLPGDRPMADFTVRHRPGMSSFTAGEEEVRFETVLRPVEGGIEFELKMENTGKRVVNFEIAGFVDWLMGVDEKDRRMLRTWNRMGACFASGAAECVGYFASNDPKARIGASRAAFLSGGDIMRPDGFANSESGQGGWVIELPVDLRPGERAVKKFVLGAEKNAARAYDKARNVGRNSVNAEEKWQREMQKMKFDTPNDALNLLANGFLQNQALNCRILAKTGLYQPGGAYGFRDQLQDMLLMIHYQPEMVRKFLLKCASRQFEAGDVLHWWHEPMNGVRTRISDDKLFLPYVTAEYVRVTGDADILSDNAAFLRDVEIPEGREDVYAPMQISENSASLHEHCMRAFRSAEKTGENGLCLMLSGDWNDGMNRVGAKGRGESVWLSMFAAVCAKKYAEIITDEADRAYLLALNERLCAAVEENGWDGEWYLRAYNDDGEKLGGKACESCKIDLISQAWAVFAGLDKERVKSAMDAAWRYLADEETGIIRLLAPPFDGKQMDPGYIAAYPPGVRENGAQYTHAACWYGCALAEMGDAERAHRALNMLLPVNHAKDRENADQYRAEPYVMAADIYTNANYPGRGGWTWYTGSAQWMMQMILSIFGYERRKNCVRIRALLGDWESASISVRFGNSEYVLTADAAAKKIMLDGCEVEGEYISMRDDGRTHHALFPPRNTEGESAAQEAIIDHRLKI